MGMTATEVKTYCLCRWGGIKVLHRYGDKDFACKIGKQTVVLKSEQVTAAIAALDWLDTPPDFPVRIPRIRRHDARPADFEGVPFERFIVCDNLYQGYLATQKDEMLDKLAAQLYDCERIKLDAAERVSVFYWFAALKAFFARLFKHFFQPASQESEDGNMFEQERSQYDMLREAVDAQIRALTKGDVTKEKEVLGLNTWRALTELDAQAREYQDMKRKYPNL